MNNSSPLISIIIPTFNRKDFLWQAVQNIESQDYPATEIIIVDDGSTDETKTSIDQLQGKIQYFYQVNKGPAAARNYGLQQANGEYIAFLDVDDLWCSNSLRKMSLILQNNPEYCIIQGLIIEEKYPFNSDDYPQKDSYKSLRSPYHFVNLGSSIYRKSVFETVGLLDESMKYGEDVDWFVRAWEKQIPKLKIDEAFLRYRIHDSNMTHNKNTLELGMLQYYKRRIDRVRKDPSLLLPHPNFPSKSEYLGLKKRAGTQ